MNASESRMNRGKGERGIDGRMGVEWSFGVCFGVKNGGRMVRWQRAVSGIW
jgi:hypothetical protein